MFYIFDLNLCKVVFEIYIESLVDSIECFGFIYNFVGFMDEDGRVGVVVGGCWFCVIQMIVECFKIYFFIMVLVKLVVDVVEVEDWVSVENVVCEDMIFVDEICVFGCMKLCGVIVLEIVFVFVVIEVCVYQWLVFVGLFELVLDVLVVGEISFGIVKVFIFFDDDVFILSFLDQVKGQVVFESVIKNVLYFEVIKVIDCCVKFVGIEVYEVEGGMVICDFFFDEVFFVFFVFLDWLFIEKLEVVCVDLVEI